MFLKGLKLFFEGSLKNFYTPQELQSVWEIFVAHFLKKSRLDCVLQANEKIPDEKIVLLKKHIAQLAKHTPIQHITGKGFFDGQPFFVSPDTLIPRPETAELVRWIVADNPFKKPRILDIGTGSGCIAISLAKKIKAAKVVGVDCCERVLKIARKNALLHEVAIPFEKVDILASTQLNTYDIIVSNPPYICEDEKTMMQKNVLDYEPHAALFVPDRNPLLFYEKIATLSRKSLSENGLLYFEINENFGQAIIPMLQQKGFTKTTLQKDIFGKDRMVKTVF